MQCERRSLRKAATLVILGLALVTVALLHRQLSCLPSVAACYMLWGYHLATGLKHLPLVEPVNASVTLVEHKIPRVIHQTWKDDTIPPRWEKAVNSCRTMYPDYTYMWWTDESARKFVAEHYPNFLHVFDSYPYNIQRADVLRYFVLHKLGGIYIDLDVGCVRRLDDQLHHEVVLPMTRPLGFSNEFMMSSPGAPFMQQLIHRLPAWANDFGFHYGTVMFSTGPMFVTVQHAISPYQRHVSVLPDALYGKFSNDSSRYLTHYPGSSWHSNDSAVVFWLYGHLLHLVRLAVIVLVVVLITCMSWRLQQAVSAMKKASGKAEAAANSKCVV